MSGRVRFFTGAPLDAGTLDAIAQRVATKLYAEALESLGGSRRSPQP